MKLQNFLKQIEDLVGSPVELQRNYNNKWVVVEDENDANIFPAKTGDTSLMDYYIVTKPAKAAVTMFQLQEFPGCCAFCISTAVWVHNTFMNRGVNNVGNKLRQYIAARSGYTAIICTDVESNIPERRTLAKNAWKDIYTVENRRTKRVVNISIKELDEWYA
jgi:hypothetical protein